MTFTTALGLQKLVEEAKAARLTGIEGIAVSKDVKRQHRHATFKKLPVIIDPDLPPGTMELRGAHMTRVRIEGVVAKPLVK